MIPEGNPRVIIASLHRPGREHKFFEGSEGSGRTRSEISDALGALVGPVGTETRVAFGRPCDRRRTPPCGGWRPRTLKSATLSGLLWAPWDIEIRVAFGRSCGRGRARPRGGWRPRTAKSATLWGLCCAPWKMKSWYLPGALVVSAARPTLGPDFSAIGMSMNRTRLRLRHRYVLRRDLPKRPC